LWPCRGRTYGPLIKSGRRPIIRQLDVAKVSPFIFENHELAGFLLIRLQSGIRSVVKILSTNLAQHFHASCPTLPVHVVEMSHWTTLLTSPAPVLFALSYCTLNRVDLVKGPLSGMAVTFL